MDVPILKQNQNVKIYMPGESPWTRVIKQLEGNRAVVRIDNDLVSDLHGYKCGDLVTVEWIEKGGCWNWELAPIEDQEDVSLKEIS